MSRAIEAEPRNLATLNARDAVEQPLAAPRSNVVEMCQRELGTLRLSDRRYRKPHGRSDRTWRVVEF